MSIEYIIPSTVAAPVVTAHHSNLDSSEERERGAGYARTITYTNGTPYVVNITEREGICVSIPSNNGQFSVGEFCVYVRYRIGPNVNINSTSLLNAAESELTDDLKAINIAIQRERAVDRRMLAEGAITFQLIYRIPVDLIDLHNGAIHLSQLGITISTHRKDAIIINPDSEQGVLLMAGSCEDVAGLRVRIEINDPERTYGSRYVNLHNRIYRIDTTVDKTKREGVYLYSTSPEFRPVGKVKDRYEFYEADDALGLYKTYDDARCHGDVAAERNREYERVKHDVRMESVEHDRVKQEGAAQTMFMKTFFEKLATLEETAKKSHETFIEMQQRLEKEREEERRRHREQESDRRKEEADQRREESEQRNSERKERLEYIKWFSATIVAIGALATAYSKMST